MQMTIEYLKQLTKKYIKEDASIKINPKLKKDFFNNSKYIIESEYKSENPYILGRVNVILSLLDTPTQNGTYYSIDWANKTLLKNEKFQSKLAKKLILGETDHPEKPDGSIKNVSHAVISIEVKGNEIWGVVEIFNTPNGSILWTLLNAGVILGVSSRGIGDEYFDGGVKKIKEDNFEMIGWDFVIDASAQGAEFKEFAEATQKELKNKLHTIVETYKTNYARYIAESLVREKKEEIVIEEEKNRINTLIEEVEFHKNKNLRLFQINKKQIEENKQLITDLKKANVTLNEKNMLLASKEKAMKIQEKKIVELENRANLLIEEMKSKDLMVEKYRKENVDLKTVKESVTRPYNVILEAKQREQQNKVNNGINGFAKNNTPRYK